MTTRIHLDIGPRDIPAHRSIPGPARLDLPAELEAPPSTGNRFQRAWAHAHEMQRPENAARYTEIANSIDLLVGTMVWDGHRTRISWPAPIAAAAGEPERHLEEVE